MGNWYAISAFVVVCLPVFIFFKGKDRREKGNFIGAPSVQQQLKDGPTRRRVGLIVEGAPARREFMFFFFFAVIAENNDRGCQNLITVRGRGTR